MSVALQEKSVMRYKGNISLNSLSLSLHRLINVSQKVKTSNFIAKDKNPDFKHQMYHSVFIIKRISEC